MTPEDRTPRKRRRRRRRTGGAGPEGQPQGNGHRPEPGNEAVPPRQYRDGGGGGGGRRRRRSRRGGPGGGGGRSDRPMPMENGSAAPIDIAPGELVAASGVLFVK